MMTKHAKTSHIVSQTMVLLMYLLNQCQCNCKQLGENVRSDGEANNLANEKGKRASINLDDGS